MLELYMIIFGIFQIIAGLFELILPVRLFKIWRTWILSKYFPLHGIFLIAGGFPLLVFKGYLTGIIFWIGIFMVLTGPFLLIYPEKIRDVFKTAENDFTPRDLRIMVYVDSVIRLAAGIIVAVACYKTFLL
jgi:hypothetical protein